MINELTDLEKRLKDVILNTCNKIGCANCDLDWGSACSATDLESKINDIKYKHLKDKQNVNLQSNPSNH